MNRANGVTQIGSAEKTTTFDPALHKPLVHDTAADSIAPGTRVRVVQQGHALDGETVEKAVVAPVGRPAKKAPPAKPTTQTDAGGRVTREEAGRLMHGDQGYERRVARKAAPRKATPASHADRLAGLRSMTSREEAHAALAGLSSKDLKALAQESGTHLGGATTKDAMRTRIVEHTVGFRLNSATIRGGSWAATSTHHTEPLPAGSGTVLAPPRTARPATSSVNHADRLAGLETATSREEGMTHLDGMTVQQLKDFAAEHKLPVQVTTKDQAKRQIVELVTGSRLSGKALRDLGEGGQPLVRDAAPARPTGPANGASRLFSEGGYGRPVTGHATNAIQDADRALARGDSPADVAAGLRHQAALLRQSQLHESDVRDQMRRTPAELREIRNLEAKRLREVADNLERQQSSLQVRPVLDVSVGSEPSWAIPARRRAARESRAVQLFNLADRALART
jgi:hypothetical protein